MASRKLDLDALTDDQLLDMRMCDLKLTIRNTPLEDRIHQLNEELAARGICFAPHCWLSDDWYSPDGIPGIAIPFYLAHPRLMRLERKQLLEVEGGTHQWCMKILRHEAGHAIDTAYRLRRKASYRKIFGNSSEPYPEYYHPKTSSRDFVLHLEMWYAQAQKKHDINTRAANDLDDATQERISRLCKRVYRALSMSGYGRMDLRMTADGEIYVIEANANPNIEYGEDFAESAEAIGITYEALLQRILNLGLNYKAAWMAV